MLHWAYIPTADGQDVEGYDFAELCVECSKKPTGWELHNHYSIKGNKFVKDK
jgi:hypothetical protein